ncbi:haloacid dehalogenase [Actinoplanes sp. ATCC 53533]|nr:haloacid dehalogenase [Actinoplanes sp. ATCC 53533]
MSVPAAGLTSAEVAAARARGEVNRVAAAGSRGHLSILRANLFTLFNNFLFAIGLTLLSLGRTKDALVSVGLGLLNSLIGTVQEIRAKQKLDRLRLLDRAPCTVIRDGLEQQVPPEDLVRGDLIRITAGDQVVVDGPVAGDGRLEVDESLLTGEAEPVIKQSGDRLLSGSLCLSGTGFHIAEAVGARSNVGTLTTTARARTVERTPLQRRIDFIVRLIMLTVALMSAAILAQAALKGLSLVRVVQTAAVLSGLVPYGLFFLITISYAVGAATIARRGALIQRINAVESLCNVDVLCTDKTGTLTTGALRLEHIEILGGADPAEVRRLLGAMVRSSTPSRNATIVALAGALPGTRLRVEEEVPFSPERRWSAVRGAGPAGEPPGCYVLGAIESLRAALPADAAASGGRLHAEAATLAGQGLRVLLFAVASDPEADLRAADGEPRLPALRPLALVALVEEIRSGVAETLGELRSRGVAVKIISGDDPRTVAALARRIGIEGPEARTGADLEAMTPEAFGEAVAHGVVFGRVTPRLKERMLAALRGQGRYTAMIGNGVNDIPSLKTANVGIAMGSGNSVARDVADVILLDDAFEAIAPAQREGRRIISGITTSMYLYLARVSTSILVIIGVAILGLGFPYEPAQVALVLFTVGLPTMVLTAWAPPTAPEPGMIGSLARFVVPAALVTSIFGVAVYAGLYQLVRAVLPSTQVPVGLLARFEQFGLVRSDTAFTDQAATIVAQTGLSVFTSVSAFALILFLVPPWRMFAGWTTVQPDKRPAALVAVLMAIFVVILIAPPLANYFSLIRDPAAFLAVGAAFPPWFCTLRLFWRYHLLERVLGLHDEP